MTSILTNPSAMTALQTLTATMQSLKNTQAHISTGLRITSAADNASYWSIATSMKSDSGVLATVSDALNMGASTLDVASTGLTNAITLLNKVKTSLAAAAQPGADRAKIQEDLQQQQNALRSTANSASFNGQNWMQIDSGQDNFNYTRSVIASYSRDADGNVNVGYIQANISTVALIDQNVGNEVTAYEAENFPTTAIRYTGTVSGTNGNGTAGDEVTGTLGWDADNSEYTVTSGGTAYTIGAEDITDLEFDGRTATLTHTDASTDPVTNEETPAKFTITYEAGGLLDTVDTSTTGTYTDSNGALTTSDAAGTGVSIMTMDISNLTDSAEDMATLNSYSQQVDNVIAKITAAATNVGAVTSRLGLQQTFVSSLQDSIDKGVGSLVDADMNLESTKLQALQVQQQLGIQSLSIANSSAQSILKLFG